MFALKLARELGYANPDLMLAEMPTTVFREWMALYAIEEEERQVRNLGTDVRARMNG